MANKDASTAIVRRGTLGVFKRGVGTATPTAKLDLRGSDGYLKFDSSGSDATIKSDYNLKLYGDDTGDNSSGYQNIQFYTAGANERMRIDSAGKVGIGTTAPGSVQLDVRSTTVSGGSFDVQDSYTSITSGASSLWLSNSNQTAGNYTRINFADAVGGSSIALIAAKCTDHTNNYGDLQFWTRGSGYGIRMHIDQEGNVGIGTTAPAAKLHVDGTTILGDISSNDWGANHAIGLSSSNGLLMSEAGQANNTNRLFLFYNDSGSPRFLMYQGNTTEKVRINSNGTSHFSGGSVGIGTTAPAYKLDVSGTGRFTGQVTIADDVFLTSGQNIHWSGNYSFITGNGANTTGNVRIYTSDTLRMTIEGDGDVGIGTTAPNAILDISDATNDNLRIGTRGGNMNLFSVTDAGAGAPLAFEGTQFHFVAGNVGIGTTFNTAEFYGGKLWVQGNRSYLTSSGNGHSTIRKEESALILGPSSTRTGTAGHYVGGIGFDHLLNYSVEGKVSYHSAGPHCWIGMSIKDTPGYERSALVFATRTGTGGSDLCTEKMRVQPDGKIGIGTTAPDSTLELSQSGNHQLKVTETGTGCETVILSQTGNGGEGWIGTQSSHILKIGTAYSAKLYLDTSGHFRPSANGTQDFGNSSFRWNNVYSEAGNFSGDVTVSGRVGVSMSPISTAGLVVNHTGDYILGLYRSGTPEWFFKTYTNGNFAIHENGVGDKFTIAAGGNATFAGNAVVTGNLTVNGTTTTIDTTNLLIEDPLMLLAKIQTGTPTLDCGLIMERGTSTNVGMIWDESADQFAFINTTDTATTAGNVTIASYANLQAGNITTGGQILTPGGSNLALNPNTGLVTVGGALTTTGNITGGGTAIFTGDMTIADDFYFKATNAWIIAGSVAGGALTGGTLRIQNFGELEVDGVLDINGTGTSTFAGALTTAGRITLSNDGSNNGLFIGGAWQIFDNASEQWGTAGDLVFYHGGSRLVIGDTGKVGIGVTDPGIYHLNVNGQGRYADHLTISNNKSIFTNDYGCNTNWRNMTFTGPNNGSSYHIVLMPGASASNVGIGTTAPSAKLHVNGTSLFTGNLHVSGSGAKQHRFGSDTISQAVKSAYDHFFIGGNCMMYRDGVNDVEFMSGAYYANDNKYYHINGGAKSKWYMYNGEFSVWTAASGSDNTEATWARKLKIVSGSTTIDNALTVGGTITENSSIALKENIFDLNTTLDKINRVRPVKYNKKTTKNKKEIGFIAEELAEIFPELVENDENGNPASVNYTRAVTVLFDGFKQMYKELKEIKEKIK